MNAFIVDCNATQKWTNAETVIDTRLFPHYQNSNGAKDESVREKYHKYFILQKKSVFSLSFSLVTFISLIHTCLMVRKKYNLISIDAFCTRKKKTYKYFFASFSLFTFGSLLRCHFVLTDDDACDRIFFPLSSKHETHFQHENSIERRRQE